MPRGTWKYPNRAVWSALLGVVICGGLWASCATAAEGQPDHAASDATVWCLDSANAGHVAAAADQLFDAVEQSGPNVRVEGKPQTLEQWRRSDAADFDAACEKAFEVYDPSQDPGSDGVDLEEWLVALISAGLGAGAGAGIAHLSSVSRDRRLWTREDAAAIRRLGGELRDRAEALTGLGLKTEEGVAARARIRSVVEELESILREGKLAEKESAAAALGSLQAMRSELDNGGDLSLETLENEARRVGELALANAGEWAAEIN